MKNLIIVAGSANTGKTITTNLVIRSLIENGYNVSSKYENKAYKCDFWKYLDKNNNYTKGGHAVLEKDGRKILVVTYGDIEKDLKNLFDKINFDEYYSVVCCSHATRNRKVFNYFYGLIDKIDFNNTNVIPIYKNLIAHEEKKDIENESLANLICRLIIN